MIEQLNAIHPLLPTAAGLLGLLLGAIIVDLVVKRILVNAVRAISARSSATCG